MDKQEVKDLKKRYLIWLYKAAKEALDRIERKFTQVEIDKFILAKMQKFDRRKDCRKFIDEFKAYVQKKEEQGRSLKYEGGKIKPDYKFLLFKLQAIENTIVKELGRAALKEVKFLYEKEMTERILKSMEHK